jgi:uncharacterized protein (DUF433 family)
LVDVIGRYSNPRGLEKGLEVLKEILRRASEANSPRSDRDEHSFSSSVRNAVRRLGKVKVGQLVADYQSGKSTTELMATYSLSKSAVLRVLESHGIALRRQPLTEQQVADAISLYESGWSLSAIVAKHGLARESVRRALVAAGVTMRQRGGSKRQEVS